MPLALLASALAGVNWPCGRLHVAWACFSSPPALPQAGIRCHWRSSGCASGLSVAMWYTSSLDLPMLPKCPGILSECCSKRHGREDVDLAVDLQEACIHQQSGLRVCLYIFNRREQRTCRLWLRNPPENPHTQMPLSAKELRSELSIFFRLDSCKVRKTDEGHEVPWDIGKLLSAMFRKGYLDLRTKELSGVQPAEWWRECYGETPTRRETATLVVVSSL
jgi:hypothetical protein